MRSNYILQVSKMKQQNVVDEIRRNYRNNCWIDFEIYLYSNGRLIIVGNSDLSYYHNFEIIINAPSYMSSDTYWTCDPLDDFMKLKIINDNNDANIILEFYSESILQFKLIAANISLNFDTVFYYKRENLSSGERLAYWIE
ncbi:hypothetical protein JW972_16140 [Escherichia fergusonii]|nr:hypothetical protein [Escherichia fergusonii]MCH5371520.1 hypothetical protein [Escherichia fergusonii]UAW42441.1 hypothetical protein JW972_16140 [Escherichia fergusonii]BED96174.1 hypothetical protein Ef30038_25980 [Escherichia fergusonii]BES13678.1 hypothetical protein Ef18B226LT_22570 [Escherichia fergusonii]